MARIVLNIEADSADDLHDTLVMLVSKDTRLLEPEEPEQPTATATQDAEPGEREARFKRTKDEIARGLTIEQAKAERATSTRSTSSETTSSAPSLTPSTNGSGNDSAEDPFASPPTSSGSPASTLTTKDVRDAMGAFLNRDGKDAAQIKDVLHQFKQENGEVVNAASQLKATDYAAFIEKLAA